MRKTAKFIYTLAAISSLATFGTFFYPTVSDAWNRYVSSKLISEYVSNESEEEDYTQEYESAVNYNKNLLAEGTNNISSYSVKLSGDTSEEDSTTLSGEVINPDSEYESEVNVFENGMMGYIEIPKINVSLPIYHYTSEEVLAKGIGHLYGSSLPVGGKGNHAVLTGHCGLMSAKLFTDLDNLIEGDIFTIHILGKELTYQVDQIKTVLPNQTEDLSIDKDKDYVTLITCTPYGVNSHRLLVRGERITNIDETNDNDETLIQKTKEIVNFPISIFIFSGLCVIIHLTIIVIIWRKPLCKRNDSEK